MSSKQGKAANGKLAPLNQARRPSCEDEEVGEALIQLAVRSSAIKRFPFENGALSEQTDLKMSPMSKSKMDQCSSSTERSVGRNGYAEAKVREIEETSKPKVSQKSIVNGSIKPNDELETHFESMVDKNNAKRKQISNMRSPKSGGEDDAKKQENSERDISSGKKHKSNGRKEAEQIVTRRGKRKLQQESQEDTPPKKNNALLKKQRLRALETLRNASDLVSMETALHLLDNELDVEDGSNSEAMAEPLIEQAAVAVPYLLHKALVELMTRGRPDGPGFSKRSASTVSSALLEKVGISSCVVDITEDDLVERGSMRPVDARRILPFLTRMGAENLDKARQLRKHVMEGDPGKRCSSPRKGVTTVGDSVTRKLKQLPKRQKAK